MLSYQHGYHAGNFCDVHKHSVITRVLAWLRRKEKPFTVLDLHAGRGMYDLSSPAAQKTGEFRDGILKVWGKPFPPAAADYEKVLKSLNGQELKRYPGSPAIARSLIRAEDALILNELHPAEFAALKDWARTSSRIQGHRRDALEALTALVPPAIRRGAVFLDPAYEVKAEYETVPEAMLASLEKWPEGTYFLWYPLLPDMRYERLVEIIRDHVEQPTLRSELHISAPGEYGLFGSGLIIVNPTYNLEPDIAAMHDWWLETGKTADAHCVLEWLRPEN